MEFVILRSDAMSAGASTTTSIIPFNEDLCILMLAVAMECHEINASNKLEELSAGDIVAGIVSGLRRHPFSASFLYPVFTSNPDGLAQGIKLLNTKLHNFNIEVIVKSVQMKGRT